MLLPPNLARCHFCGGEVKPASPADSIGVNGLHLTCHGPCNGRFKFSQHTAFSLLSLAPENKPASVLPSVLDVLKAFRQTHQERLGSKPKPSSQDFLLIRGLCKEFGPEKVLAGINGAVAAHVHRSKKPMSVLELKTALEKRHGHRRTTKPQHQQR